jgi:hypothetical protein
VTDLTVGVGVGSAHEAVADHADVERFSHDAVLSKIHHKDTKGTK